MRVHVIIFEKCWEMYNSLNFIMNSILGGGRKCNNQNYCYNIERKSGE